MADPGKKQSSALRKTFFAAAVGLPAIAAAAIGYAGYNAEDSFGVRHTDNGTVYSHTIERWSDSFFPETKTGYTVKEIIVPDNGGQPMLAKRDERVKYILGIPVGRDSYPLDSAPVDIQHIGSLRDMLPGQFDDAAGILKDIDQSKARNVRLASEGMLRDFLKDTPAVFEAFNRKYGSYDQATQKRRALEDKSHAGVRELLGIDPSAIRMDQVRVRDPDDRVYDGQNCVSVPMIFGKMVTSRLSCTSKYRTVERHHMEPRLPRDIQARLDAAQKPYADRAAEIRRDQGDYDFCARLPAMLEDIAKDRDRENEDLAKYGNADKASEAAQARLEAGAKSIAGYYEAKSHEIPLVTPALNWLRNKGPGL